jgi:hypothetical protein
VTCRKQIGNAATAIKANIQGFPGESSFLPGGFVVERLFFKNAAI